MLKNHRKARLGRLSEGAWELQQLRWQRWRLQQNPSFFRSHRGLL
jgi:hypothetical protein